MESELEVFLIFVRILIIGTVQNCTVLNITKYIRILADNLRILNKDLDQQQVTGLSGYSPGYWEIQDFQPSGHWDMPKDIGKFNFREIRDLRDLRDIRDIRDIWDF